MRRKRKILCLLLAVVLLPGLVYWKVRKDHNHAQELTRQAEELESAIESLGWREVEFQRNLAKWYNYNLELGTPGMEDVYETILNFGQGRMAVLAVPEWGLWLPVYHGGGGVVSHDPATPLPMGGRGKHTVLIVSESYPWVEGLSLHIDCLGQRALYRVESVQVMDAHWSVERPTEDGQDLLTLVFDRGNKRTLVRCVRCSELVLREGKREGLVRYVVPAVVLAGLVIAWLWRSKRTAIYVQRARICGFCRKNRGKTKLL